MYIQPCCIEKELPQLLKQHPYCFFQSNGDWQVTDLMKSVSCLIPHSLILLAIPEVDVFLLRTIRTYLSKGWYRGFVLLTSSPQAELVKSEMGNLIQLVSYANHYQVQDGMLALTDFNKYLVIQGAMLLEKDFSLCKYTAYYGTEPRLFASAIEAETARVKMGAFIKSPYEDIKSLLDKDYIRE